MCSVRGAMRSLHEPSPPSMQSVALMYIRILFMRNSHSYKALRAKYGSCTMDDATTGSIKMHFTVQYQQRWPILYDYIPHSFVRCIVVQSILRIRLLE